MKGFVVHKDPARMRPRSHLPADAAVLLLPSSLLTHLPADAAVLLLPSSLL